MVTPDALRVTAYLSSPLCGDPPHLDSLMIQIASRLQGKPELVAGEKIEKDQPLPDSESVRIPILRQRFGDVNLTMISDPILDEVEYDRHEYVVKRLDGNNADMLAPENRTQINHGGDWTKAYRIPIRVRNIAKVAWLCVGTRREVKKVLRYANFIGKKTAHGHGRVERWDVERIGEWMGDLWPIWAPSEAGPVLLRTIPDFMALPDMVGAKRDYGSCVDPYWHPLNFREILKPC